MSNPLKAYQRSLIADKTAYSNEATQSVVDLPSVLTVRKSASAEGSSSVGKNRRCINCLCPTTPLWRRGPTGPGTMCNACGVKWKQGKLFIDDATIEANLLKIKFELNMLEDSEQHSQKL